MKGKMLTPSARVAETARKEMPDGVVSAARLVRESFLFARCWKSMER